MLSYYKTLLEVLRYALDNNGIDHVFYDFFSTIHLAHRNLDTRYLPIYQSMIKDAIRVNTKTSFTPLSLSAELYNTNIPVYKAHIASYIRYIEVKINGTKKQYTPQYTYAELDKCVVDYFFKLRPVTSDKTLTKKQKAELNKIKTWKYSAIKQTVTLLYELQQFGNIKDIYPNILDKLQ